MYSIHSNYTDKMREYQTNANESVTLKLIGEKKAERDMLQQECDRLTCQIHEVQSLETGIEKYKTQVRNEEKDAQFLDNQIQMAEENKEKFEQNKD